MRKYFETFVVMFVLISWTIVCSVVAVWGIGGGLMARPVTIWSILRVFTGIFAAAFFLTAFLADEK